LADSYAATEDTPLTASPGVLANDLAANGVDPLLSTDAYQANLVSDVASGTLALATDGTFTYLPAGVADAVEQFAYQACDAGALCATATATITVQAMPNVAPVAVDDNASTSRNTALPNLNLVANDTDANGVGDIVPSTMTLTNGVTTRGGQVFSNGDGTVNYTPKRNFRGTDTFTYTVKDQAGATSNVATVRINVL